MTRDTTQDRAWANAAILRINAENNRSADTHLYSAPLPEHWGVRLYVKDESAHRTGSLKHRLARHDTKLAVPEWLKSQELDLTPHDETLDVFFTTGSWPAGA